MSTQPYFKKPVNIEISVEAAKVIGLNQFDKDRSISYKDLKFNLLKGDIEFNPYFLPEDFNLKGYLLTKKDEFEPNFKYHSSTREIFPCMNALTDDVLVSNRWYKHYTDNF